MRQPVPFGKYLLLDRISVGGMAEVFKAKSYGVEGFEKIIAIKRILPTMGEDRDFIKMFIDEAKIAGQLAHANICQIFELGRIDGSHFIAMEYIWGKDLLQIQNRVRKLKQQMPVPMACFAIAKVLEGLDYAHRKRDPLGRPLEIVHRDCSPQNVLISYEGEVKVIDFGIAKATSRNSRTMAGVLKGKFGYMSPEQVRGLPLDRRSDIFALGTMLYECLTGERLFQGETDFSTLEKVRNVDIQPPRAVNPAIPEAVEKVILKALAKDVDDRYQWCSEMLADLQAYLMTQDVVFTAKSLSSWLKEIFAQEIERERQQLEQYKRVGRDGLIAGVPAAEAKLDVVEHLGEAGVPEGDSTVLGGPSFEEMEAAMNAAPDVSQSPSSSRKPGPPAKAPSDDDSGDFGEEAPTEIFGDDPVAAVAAAAAARPAAPPSVRDLQQPLGKAPPKPPPGRPSTQRPAESGSPVPMAAAPQSGPVGSHQSHPNPMPIAATANDSPAYQPPVASPPYGQQPGFANSQQSTQIAMGTPALPLGTHGNPLGPQGNPLGQPANALAGNAAPAKTVLGVQAPPGLGNYGSGAQAAYRPSPNDQSSPYGQYGHSSGGYPQQPQQYPPSGGYQQPQYPMQPSYGQPQAQYGGYPSGPLTAPPLEPQVTEGKRSTLARDIGIGVGIAALVLVAFLVVKMFVLDKGGDSKDQPPSTIATVHLKMTAGVTGRMAIDDKDSMTVSDGQDVPVNAGKHHIKIVGPVNACDTIVQLEGGKTTTLDCVLAAAPAGSAAGSASAQGSAATQQVAAGSDAAKPETKAPETKGPEGQGSAAVKAIEPPDTKGSASTKTSSIEKTTTTTTKTPETKAPETKAPETKTTTTTTKSPETKVNHTEKTTTTTKTTETKQAETSKMPDTGAADPTKGYLQVFSKPVAKILVDGVDTGMKTPISGHALSLTPGKHKITFVIGDDRFTYPTMIKAGTTETMSKDLQ
ncbi:MAG TPA: protein kinase [Kofleriaceae bacterium]|nr:protein kinase [Kofleriaceae bacterium]